MVFQADPSNSFSSREAGSLFFMAQVVAIYHDEYIRINDPYWIPNATAIKVNMCSFWCKSDNKVALAALARGPQRGLVAVGADHGLASSAPEAEAKACLFGVRLAEVHQLDLGNVVFETHFFSDFVGGHYADASSVRRLADMNLRWEKVDRAKNHAASQLARLADWNSSPLVHIHHP